jgi:hypothetical protein
MDIAEIQQAIETLSKDQQAVLAAWLSARDQAEWDSEWSAIFHPEARE